MWHTTIVNKAFNDSMPGGIVGDMVNKEYKTIQRISVYSSKNKFLSLHEESSSEISWHQIAVWSSENDAVFKTLVHWSVVIARINLVIEPVHHLFLCLCDHIVHEPIH